MVEFLKCCMFAFILLRVQHLVKDMDGAVSFVDIWPLMVIIDRQFIRRSIATQLFLLVDINGTGYLELVDFMHLFRTIHQSIAKPLQRIAAFGPPSGRLTDPSTKIVNKNRANDAAVSQWVGRIAGVSLSNEVVEPLGGMHQSAPIAHKAYVHDFHQQKSKESSPFDDQSIREDFQLIILSRLLTVRMVTKVMLGDPASCASIMERYLLSSRIAATINFKLKQRKHQHMLVSKTFKNKYTHRKGMCNLKSRMEKKRQMYESRICDRAIR